MRKTIAVIGLGRFGMDLVRSFSTKNVNIIAIDKDKINVAKVGNVAENAIICDSTNVEALKEAGLENCDDAIIAFGQDSQANVATTILTAMALKKVGVKKIICRIDDEIYEEILLRLGVDKVILPFNIASESLAMSVSSSSVMDYYNVTEGFNVFEIKIKDTVKTISLVELNSPVRFGINIILIARDKKTFMPTKNDVIKPGDHIFAFGSEKSAYDLNAYLANEE